MQKTAPAVPRENRSHGDAAFPIASYHYTAKPGEPVIDCHWHEEAEFVVVLEGAMLLQIGTTCYPLRKGEAAFVHGGDIHAGHPYGNDGCSFWAVVFDMGMLASRPGDRLPLLYLAPLLESRRSLPGTYTQADPCESGVLQLLRELRADLDRRGPGVELAVKARLYMILSEIAAARRWIDRPDAAGLESRQLEQLKTVLSYIEAHYQDKIYLRHLADLAHMGESQFCRFFKKLVRKTPVEYINSFRIRKAAELLELGSRKLLDISLEVGFENPSYFIKRFRQEMGCTPAEYRKTRQQPEG